MEILQTNWLCRPMMIEQKSFDLLSLYNGKQPIFKNVKHYVKNNIEKTAIIPIHGILTKKPGAFDDFLGMTSYEKIQEEIEEASSNKDIETILLDIDSPGGEVNGLFDLADFIYESRAKKRIVAIANDDAYSAAYAIASSAEKVFVSRTSGVGSIGVIASHIDQSRFDEKQGIKYTTIFAGKRKNDLNPHEPISLESLKSLEEEVNRLYEILTELIARNRGLSVQAIKNTEAGLYFGEKAVEIGLADGVTTFFEFINKGENTMNKQTTTDLETDNLTKYRTEVVELIRLCNLSRMPEKIGEFIEQGVSIEQAREVLMELLAERTKKTEILSAIPQNSGEDLMMQVARSRAQSGI
ncbi:S49 family peptidase [Wolbachia endosymbiont of Diaphorina citri]|uniref:S49 family peptidase n=1 Tax=Wolbachia endosymbiont of Diaphorina citri TaxID=116598 RepID=UPI00155E2FBC|nr:S49 family peptidase [Wolbachia endosymbiont of Diaphorina citri]QJT94037.1 S49 family peptidase [Wolbachia endosymbiont of Diaphorina citri]QJT95278.1 S49 family peptidase [Wolbachia endosymbiont of Diaphorina citri]QJT96524.1 S49 family peptidase [Wolbachia endosymbiont of Diaphorina citri]QLK10933.1 S49 family peptidase [Wolbachia endosymbiont of Diaphorina citri]QXY86603.1 S49 family peptidase [Wolbachia endosymbiont of Diaphorina citri]